MFELDDVLWMGKRGESLGELYELCDNSSDNCSNYAEFTVSYCSLHDGRHRILLCGRWLVARKVSEDRVRISDLNARLSYLLTDRTTEDWIWDRLQFFGTDTGATLTPTEVVIMLLLTKSYQDMDSKSYPNRLCRPLQWQIWHEQCHKKLSWVK